MHVRKGGKARTEGGEREVNLLLASAVVTRMWLGSLRPVNNVSTRGVAATL